MISFLTLLLACSQTSVVPLHFDGPIAAAVLAADDGPFREPTGYVANLRSGTVIPLDLKHGRLLTDDTLASFVRASPIALGTGRLLSDVGVIGNGDRVVLWAIDNARGVALRAPYLTSVDDDGVPVEQVPDIEAPEFVLGAEGNGISLRQLAAHPGRTTTEIWTFAWNGRFWSAAGSRAARQVAGPVAGVPWQSEGGEISFVLEGVPREGEEFTVETRSGLTEHPVGVRAMALAVHEGVVYVSGAEGRVARFDGLTGEALGEVVLPAGAQPGRMTVAPDGRLFVADGSLPVVWILRFDLDSDPASVGVERIDTTGPVVDVAWQGGLDASDASFDHLFVAVLGTQRVDVWDNGAGAWFDPNPLTLAVEGIDLGSPITGLSASLGPVKLARMDAWGAIPRVPTVLAAAGDGKVHHLEGATGCAVTDIQGPHASLASDGSATVALQDLGAVSDADLVIQDESGLAVVPSPCGGVTRSESWTVIYDSARLTWAVEGTRSGIQTRVARSGQRYVSDSGAVSFLVVEGALPPTDGDRFSFTMDAGLQVFRCSDNDANSACTSADTNWDLPGRPAAFETFNGSTGGGWDEVDQRQYMMLPVTNTDIVARLRLDAGDADVKWQ